MPTPVHRSDGRWQVQATAQGKRTTFYGPTSEAAYATYLRSLTPSTPPANTVEQLLDQFLLDGDKGWKPRTRTAYHYYALLIRQEIGQTKLNDLRGHHIRDLLSTYADRPRTARYLYQTLHRAYELAILWELVDTNPCNRLRPPHYHAPEKTIWTVQELNQFFHTLIQREEDRWYGIFYLAFATGLRIGEILALRWDDLNALHGTLRVERTLCQIGQTFQDTATKTAAGRRTLTLERDVVAILEASPRVGDRIFCTQGGTPHSRNNVNRALKRRCLTAGVPVITMHSFRHLHASLALHSGAPLTLVSRALGHANVGITTQVYAHAIGNGSDVSRVVIAHLLPEGLVVDDRGG